MLPFRILSTVACEDIRREIGGRHTLVGVIGTVFRANEFPIDELWHWFMELMPTQTGDFDGEARLIGPNETVLTRGSIEVSFSALRPVLFVISAMPIQFQGPGQYEFQLKFDDDGDDWETVKTFEVRERTPPRSTPPSS